jgi:hypothetical protein
VRNPWSIDRERERVRFGETNRVIAKILAVLALSWKLAAAKVSNPLNFNGYVIVFTAST